jgi:hypothetical protein
MAWRRDTPSDGLDAVRAAAAELAETEGWLDGVGDPGASWLPEPDASRLANGEFRVVTAPPRA